MSPRVKFELDGNTYYIQRMDPFRALKVLGTLQKSFLGPAFHLVDIRAAGNEEEASALLGKAVRAISETLDGDSLVAVTRLLLDPELVSVHMAGQAEPVKLTEGNVNLAMGGAEDLVLLCIEVVKVNYENFWKRASALIGKAQTLRTGLNAL